MTTRRSFLASLGASAALATAGRARAAVCSNVTLDPLTDYTWPGARPRYKILEILQLGGVSHRETTWVENPDAPPVWRALGSVAWSTIALSGQMPTPFDLFPMNGSVSLGPSCKPLTNTLIRDRIRTVAVAHHLDPHDPARAYVLGGRTFGRSQYFGLGAAIQRRHGGGPLPAAYVLDTGSPLVASYAASTGMHLAQNRPVVLPITDTDVGFLQRLDRSAEAGADELLAWYDCEYDADLTFAGTTQRARSAGYQAYAAARDAMDRWADLRGFLQAAPPLFVGVQQAQFSPILNRTRTAIHLACWLLSQPSVHYVCVVDNGVPRNGVNVDSHATATLGEHATLHATNVWSTCRALEEEVVANQSLLADTMVLLHSEFGRANFGGTGTEHWTRGYPMMLIGGPVPARGVRGGISFTGTPQGVATPAWTSSHNPTDVRCAVALAAGLDPFHADLYAPADTTAASTTSLTTLRANLKSHVLGA